MNAKTPRKNLGELFHFKNGRGFKKTEWGNQGLPIIRIQNLNDATAEFNYYNGVYEKEILVQENDLLFSWSGTVGSSFGPHIWTRQDGLLNQHIFKIGFKTDLESRYAYYALEFITEEIERAVNGAVGLVHITKEKLNQFTIPIPGKADQQRIVAILDEAFDGIATARANAVKNLQNAREVFESHLEMVFTAEGEGRQQATLGDVCNFIGGSQPPKSSFQKLPSPENIRLIQIRDYKSDKHLVYIPRSLAKRFCSADDVMIGRYGPPLFQILRGLEGAYNVALMKAVPDEKKLTRDYLYFFLKHPSMLKYVIYHSERAAGQIGLTKDTLEPYPIFLPALSAQRKVTDNIREVESESQRLESIYDQKVAALAELKQSLLHQAFNDSL